MCHFKKRWNSVPKPFGNITIQQNNIQQKGLILQPLVDIFNIYRKHIFNKNAFAGENQAIDNHLQRMKQQNYNEPTKLNIIKIYEEIDRNQIVGSKEIKEILGCSYSTAKSFMQKMRDIDVVKVVEGKGKGRYIIKKN